MKAKRIVMILFLVSAILFAGIPVRAADYNARSYILMEASTGKVIYEKEADKLS